VFVTPAGDWRLGGLDLASPIDDIRNARSCPVVDYLLSPKASSASGTLQLPPELGSAKSGEALADLPAGAIDAWGLAVLIYHIFNWHNISRPFDKMQLKEVTRLPVGVRETYVKLLSASPRHRLATDRILDCPYFADNEFIETCLFLEQISIKDSFEKDKFFRKLPKLIEAFPDYYLKKKILPHLVSALDFGGVNSLVLPPLLRISGMLSEAEYRREVMPSAVKWFTSTDRALRIALLQNLGPLIGHLDQTTASRDIFPALSQGFVDEAPQLRELTVIAVVSFAPLLTSSLMNGDVLKFLAKLQVDPQPGVRYNTAVALGKISKYLTPQVQ